MLNNFWTVTTVLTLIIGEIITNWLLWCQIKKYSASAVIENNREEMEQFVKISKIRQLSILTFAVKTSPYTFVHQTTPPTRRPLANHLLHRHVLLRCYLRYGAHTLWYTAKLLTATVKRNSTFSYPAVLNTVLQYWYHIYILCMRYRWPFGREREGKIVKCLDN